MLLINVGETQVIFCKAYCIFHKEDKMRKLYFYNIVRKYLIFYTPADRKKVPNDLVQLSTKFILDHRHLFRSKGVGNRYDD
jgi:hypothetical protein